VLATGDHFKLYFNHVFSNTGQNNVRRLTKSCEEDQEKGQEPPHLSHSDAAQGKKQQDFVKKNIEVSQCSRERAEGVVPEFIP